MFSNILLPIDLNHPESWARALPEALDLQKASGGALHLMTVVPDFGMSLVHEYFPPDFEEKALAKAKAALDAFVAEHAPGANIATHIAHGSTPDRILKTAEDLSADLIVMASHEPDQIRDFLVGSNADRVVHRATIPVLVIRG